MKKIAIIDYDMSIVGGVEQVSANLANELAKYYDVYLISLNNKNKSSAYVIDKRVRCFTIINEPNSRLKSTILKSRKELRNILKKNTIDVALNMGTYAGFVSIIDGCLSCKTKMIFCDHGSVITQMNDKTITFMRKISTIFSNHTVVLTDRSLNDYIEKFNVSNQKITRIYNWIDENIYEYENAYNLNSKKIVSSGRFSSEKRYDLLINVAIELKKMTSDWVWDIYGTGETFESIKDSIFKNHLENHLILKGLTNTMYDKYNKYSMLVLTSEREGLPLVLLEAKACKLPLISFDILTGPKEIIVENNDGYLIKKFDVYEMASKIFNLLENKNKRIEFSNNSKKNINKFSKQLILEQWINLIEKVCVE